MPDVAALFDRPIDPAGHEGVELERLLGGLERARVGRHAAELGELREQPSAVRVERADRRGRESLGQPESLVAAAQRRDLGQHWIVVAVEVVALVGQRREEPGPHLRRGGAGEGDRDDLLGRGPRLASARPRARDDPQVATDEPPGLARAGARDQHDRAARIEDRTKLVASSHPAAPNTPSTPGSPVARRSRLGTTRATSMIRRALGGIRWPAGVRPTTGK